MTSIKIEGGCTQLSDTLWVYKFTTNESDNSVFFNASRRPRIGDTIENGVLVDAVLPQSNQDKSKWQTVDYQEWPEAK